jgi:splicing factor U2AF subunit
MPIPCVPVKVSLRVLLPPTEPPLHPLPLAYIAPIHTHQALPTSASPWHLTLTSSVPAVSGSALLPPLSPLSGTAHSQQATRHARRVYVGGLPPTANEQSVATFFSHALAAVGGNTAGPGEGQGGQLGVWGAPWV